VTSLLSNRARPWVAAACLGWLLVMAGVYAHYSVTKPVGFRYCLEHVEECRGRTILLPLWRVTALRDDGYDLYKITGPIPVEGDPDGLELGDTISAVTTFDSDRRLLVEQRHEVHHLRKFKVALGLIGLALSVVLVLVGFRWRDGGVVARG
jgi:hypothetical protein